MDRDLLPTADCGPGGETVGGLPAVTCPTPEPVAYSYDIGAQYATDPLGPGSGVAFVVGVVGAIAPDPGDSMTFIEIALPTADEAPAAGDEPGPETPSDFQTMGEVPNLFFIPLSAGNIPFDLGTPLYIRMRVTDANGCASTFLAYFPEGVLTPPDDTPILVSVNGGPYTELVAHGDDVDPENPETMAVVDEPGVCPPGNKALAVYPGCGAFPVQLDTDGEPLEVTGVGGNAVEVTGVGGDPVTVTPAALPLPVTIEPAAPTVAAVTYGALFSTDGTFQEGEVPAGAREVTIRYHLADGAAASLLAWPLARATGSEPVDGEQVTLRAPEGKTLPAIDLQVTATGAGFDWVAIA